MPIDTKSLLIGGGVAIAVVFGGMFVYQKVKTQATINAVASAVGNVAKRILGQDDELTPCQRAARSRAASQGAVGTIPLGYGNVPMAAFNRNPALMTPRRV